MFGRRILCMLLALVLFAQACANVSDEGVLTVPDEVLPVYSSVGVEGSGVASSGSEASIEVSQQVSDESGARVVYRSDRAYLEGEVPPCSVDGGSGGDPCAPSSPSRRETKGVSASISGVTELNFLTRLLGPDGLDTMGTHLVVRGVVQDDSTRCEAYPFILERYAPDDIKAGLPSLDRMYFYMCFADFIVSDYIIGEGPPLLTVALYGTYPSKASFDEAISSGISEEEHMDYPQAWTANEFEGKELVLFLTTPDTLAVETWFAIDIWFVQRNDKGDIIVTSRNIDFAINDEVRSQLIIPLEELVQRVRKAVGEHNILTEGRIGIDTRLPPAMTDAYELRDYYEAAGAVYGTVEGATVLPPPVPGEGDPPPPTIPTNEGTTSSSVPEPTSSSSIAEQSPVRIKPVMKRPKRDYLNDIIFPCIVDSVSVKDPCSPGMPSGVETLSVSGSFFSWPYEEGVPTFREILLGIETLDTISHLVIRGKAKTGTTRCEPYPLQRANYRPSKPDFLRGLYHYHCFVDIVVHEYIVGTGPPLLTVSLHRENLWDIDLDNWDNIKEEELKFLEDPRFRTAEKYEGKELILFLGTPSTIAVESWKAWGYFDIWFIQNTPSGIRVVAQDIVEAINDEQRNLLDYPLEVMVREVKKASEERNQLTTGRIGIDTRLPMLVTDANDLRNYYESVGAVYGTVEGATVLPPPVPGEGDPSPPTIPTNEGTTNSSVPEPGEETTVPPSTDDAGDPSEEGIVSTTEAVTTTAATTSTTEVAPTVATTTEPVESPQLLSNRSSLRLLPPLRLSVQQLRPPQW